MTKQIQKGFTLIELMIVIAIVAILVALAVPAYQDYTIRTKVGECVNGAAPAKLAVSEFFQTVGSYPVGGANAGFDNNSGVSQYCDAWGYNGGNIIINANEDALHASITPDTIAPVLVPTANTDSGVVDWDCQSGTTAAGATKYLPSTCRD